MQRKVVFSISGVGSVGYPYGKNMNRHLYLTSQTKITVKVIRGLHVKVKQQQHMFSRRSKQDFLKAQNAVTIKKKINISRFIKVNCSSSKDRLREWKGKTQPGRS